ncbi:uncharacterized protein LOC110889878 isoform X2 [Helianthus annuus]|uniref:uncharacterized protein LOC110889878 isoform X2 n=1 Tax=Helianthus annuus TaxID=4232 RepID=UPI001652F733|nr:uncharacterized protein LOC110889878 isoform X2 [Helianthus annuus]
MVNRIPSTPWFQPSLMTLQVLPFSGSRDDYGGVTEEVCNGTTVLEPLKIDDDGGGHGLKNRFDLLKDQDHDQLRPYAPDEDDVDGGKVKPLKQPKAEKKEYNEICGAMVELFKGGVD